MNNKTLKIAVPMAGLGTRMRPHTWSKPKPLVSIAGRTVLDYVLEQFVSVPKTMDIEYVFIIGPQGEQIKEFMEERHPEKKVHYVVQAEMRGQSDALYQAREHLTGPMIMAFSDTLVETDFSFLADAAEDGVAWVKPVPDPRRFGVAETDSDGRVTRLIEKPQDLSNNLVVVGFYYFRSGEQLIAAIEKQMNQQIKLKNEFFLADAVNILLDEGYRMRTQKVDVWMDAGTPDSVLETNRYLLEHGRDNTEQVCQRLGVTVIPPVFIHETARIESCVIGPNVSIGPECELTHSIVSNAILEEGTVVEKMILENSLIGRNVHLCGQPIRLNLGRLVLGDELVEDDVPVSNVECHAGYIYPERPIAFSWQGERLEIDSVDAQWRTPEGKWFRVRTRDGQVFDLFYREMVDEWQVTPL